MNTSDVLVINCSTYIDEKQRKKLYSDILEQKEKGLIILPPYCEAIITQNDIEIVLENNIRIRRIEYEK